MIDRLFSRGSFTQINNPEGHGEVPHCPNTQLINICADLAGMKLNPGRFCGHTEHNPHYSSGAIHWLESADYFPETACLETNYVLNTQLEIARKQTAKPDESEYLKKMEGAQNMKIRKEVVDEYTIKQSSYEQRQVVIDRWKKVIFENCHPSNSDEQNHHFRSYRNADELDESQVIEEAEKFIVALNEITAYEPNIIRGHGGAINCPKSPRHHSHNRI